MKCAAQVGLLERAARAEVEAQLAGNILGSLACKSIQEGHAQSCALGLRVEAIAEFCSPAALPTEIEGNASGPGERVCRVLSDDEADSCLFIPIGYIGVRAGIGLARDGRIAQSGRCRELGSSSRSSHPSPERKKAGHLGGFRQ